MAKTHILKCRVTPNQHEIIKHSAMIKGMSVASYLRNLALQNNNFIEDKMVQIDKATNKLLQIMENG